MSESWERENLTLDKVIKLDNYQVISNVHQRTGKGGRPAIIVDTKNYLVENLTQTVVDIPWGVEAVWAVLTPRNVTNTSKVKKIVVGSIYSKPHSKKKTLLYDHISQVYNQLSSKYANGLHWIICGDTNDLKLDPILHMNSKFTQVVQDPTRLDPPQILDPIITTLTGFYQIPKCLPPLAADSCESGKPSDHKMVVMEPISSISNKPARTKRAIVYRPVTEQNLLKMSKWLENEDWSTVTQEKLAHSKAKILQDILVQKYEEFFPEKRRLVSNDDQPFFNEKLATLKRRKCREYSKNRRSEKWVALNALYVKEVSKAKRNFYRQKIKHLRHAKPKQWHKELKKLTNFGQNKSDEIIVESIKDLSRTEQAEVIADEFSKVSQEYEEVRIEDIEIPEFTEKDIPHIKESDVIEAMSKMDPNKSNVTNDIPAKIFKRFACQLGKPVTDVINASIRQGVWPNIFKMEIVTPVPKVSPPKNIEDLRNISGLPNLDKIAEKVIAKLIISDMKAKLDPSQFANQEGLGIQHYLVKFIDRILKAVDKNSKSEVCAVLATLVDWKQAFPRQCPTLGIKSFIQNGVRPALIPLLINYFQGRQMKVKWKGGLSKPRVLKGGGPQGSTFGIWEYLSQSNTNADFISESDKFKFVDDLSFLEIIYLITVGLSSYNIRQHIPTNVPVHNQFIPAQHLRSQKDMEKISSWTKNQKMQLNLKKTKNMIFNFSRKYKFSTQISCDTEKIKTVKEAKLLGTIITDDLKWDKNTAEIVKKAYRRMQLLHRSASFTNNISDLKSIYLTYVRSILEQSAVVWHSSLSAKNRKDLERVQKSAVKVILGKQSSSYKKDLDKLKIDSLNERRRKICLKFAKKCLLNEKVKNLFPKNSSKYNIKTRNKNKYAVYQMNTERYKKSSIPYMIDLLNNDERKRIKTIEDS